MPRRKQQKPKHLEDPEEVATSLQNGFGSGSGSETEGDEHVCGKCRAEFPTLSDFLLHKKSCVSKRPVLVAPDDSDPSATAPLDSSMDTDDDEDDDLYDEAPHLDLAEMHDWIMEHRPRLRSLLMGPNTNVTLAELENTSVAVAQLGQNGSSPLNQLVSSFRQNQVEQINLLKVIARLMVKDPSPPPLIGAAAFTPPSSNRHATNNLSSATVSESAPGIAAAYPQGGRTQDSPMMTLPPQEDSLALLQKHTERYIQDSMARKSFLNGMADDNRSKKGKDSDPAARHKCGFCGKHLGSESALQIHLRSHTGEKPFQCDVCGSAFSTRGNLKVHQQRHKERMELLPPNFNSCDEQRKLQQHADGRPAVGDGNPPNLFVNGSDDRDISKVEQALDFSKTVNGQKSPQGDINSRSISPNDTSNFTDNSMDGTSDENINEENYSNLKIDVERFDDDGGDNSDGLDDDELEMASSHPSFSTSPNFAPYFLPSPYDNYPSTSQVTPGSSTLTSSNANNNNNNATTANNEGSDNILHDPTFYQDLLPRIGSNDNSWESLIEVTKTSETSKLQQLVDNIENKLIEPNQCIICHRVLSCKSALQMHYRTHTGERPYRCKLCNRAFTTKGNLKTHMGVHRTKSSSRLMHQCPVCHRQYPNSMVLQQHIRSHTSDHVMQLPPLYSHRDDRPSTLLPPSYPRQFLMPTSHVGNSEPLALTKTPESQKLQSTSTSESVIKPTGVDNNLSQISSVSPALSNRSSCSPPSNIDEVPSDKEQKSTVLNFAQSDSDTPLKSEAGSPREISLNHRTSPSPEKDEISVNGMDEDMKVDEESSPKQDVTRSSPVPSPNLETEARSPIDVPGKISPKYLTPNNALMVTLASDRPLPMTLPSDMPIPFSVHGADRHYPPMSIPSCTPNSYTASLTALENHVKGINSNVTHPLPFPPHFGLSLNMSSYFRDYNFHPKPPTSSPTTSKNGSDVSADDRSTPGGPTASVKGDSPRSSNNNNNHHHHHHKHDSSTNGGGALDLTPRSSPAFQRPPPDLSIFQPLAGLPFAPQHHRHSTTCRVCFKTFACNSALEIHYRSHTKERPFRCEVCDRGFSTKGNMRQHMLTHKIRDFPPQAFSASSNSSPSPNASSSLKAESVGEKSPTKPKSSPDEAVKRPSPDTSLPGPPKRTPGQPKHMCQVCHKPFSSGSALQIHMRTHTGDKPFQCHICHRAFTTKGNLKVHMGTHMWSNSTSRRGRRMSLDISPLQLTPTGKPGDFGQAPYFPYLSPFMNGLPPPPPQPPPKMNEISVIQTAGMGNGIGCTAPPTITTSSVASTSQQPLALLAPSSSASKQTDREEASNFSNQNQNPLHSQGKDIHAPSSSQEMAWPWKISCNVCNKICSSSTELELHLRNSHRKNDSQESDRTD